MLARELKDEVRRRGRITVQLLDEVGARTGDGQGDLSDFGDSMARDSTYLMAGMLADIVDSCQMPALPDMLDAIAYKNAIEPGRIYFVFRHDQYADHNESLASREWISGESDPKVRKRGTAIEVGAYTGYDVVGFFPEDDVGRLFGLRS